MAAKYAAKFMPILSLSRTVNKFFNLRKFPMIISMRLIKSEGVNGYEIEVRHHTRMQPRSQGLSSSLPLSLQGRGRGEVLGTRLKSML